VYWIRTIKLVPEYASNKQYGKAFCIWMRAVVRCPFKVKENTKRLYRLIRAMFRRK
jgi:hypothetical protein